MARQAIPFKITAGERHDLRELLKSGVVPARTVIRALALMRLDAGSPASQVAAMLELTSEGVRKIALRYRSGGWKLLFTKGRVRERSRPWTRRRSRK